MKRAVGRKWLFVVSAVVVSLCVVMPAIAQDTDKDDPERAIAIAMLDDAVGEVVRVTTHGGGRFQGTLLTVAADRVEIQDGEGLILAIAKREITEASIIDPEREGDTFYQDAAANKLIVMPTAFPLQRGELHIANLEIVSVTATYGVTDWLSLWGGLSIPGALINLRGSFMPGPRIGLSAGALVVSVFFGESLVVLPYALASFGTENENFTAGVGAPLTFDGEFTPRGAGVLAGKSVISQTVSVITENWILVSPEDAPFDATSGQERLGVWTFPAVAFRIAGSRFSWDIGVTMPFTVGPQYNYNAETEASEYSGYAFSWFADNPIPIPILQFTYRVN